MLDPFNGHFCGFAALFLVRKVVVAHGWAGGACVHGYAPCGSLLLAKCRWLLPGWLLTGWAWLRGGRTRPPATGRGSDAHARAASEAATTQANSQWKHTNQHGNSASRVNINFATYNAAHACSIWLACCCLGGFGYYDGNNSSSSRLTIT